MAQRTIGIIVAMPEEIRPLLRGIPAVVHQTIGVFPVYRFTEHNRQFALIESGIGADRALSAAQTLTEALNPELLISMGFGGGISPELAVGDLVVGTRFFVHEGDCMIEETGARVMPLPASLAGAGTDAGFTVAEGTIISSRGVQSKTAIAGQLSEGMTRAVVDMETGAIVRFATLSRMPFMAIRSISDDLHERLGFAMDEFMDSSMRVSVRKVIFTVLRKPRIIPQLYRLYRNSRRAGKNLGRLFTLLREQLA